MGSGGGHLANLLLLRPAWDGWSETWAVLDTPDARDRLAGERVEWVPRPFDRHHLLEGPACFARARRWLARERPNRLVTTGAGLSAAFVAAARLRGIPCAFVEVFDRVSEPTLSARVAAGLGAAVFVQHRALAGRVRGARWEGGLW